MKRPPPSSPKRWSRDPRNQKCRAFYAMRKGMHEKTHPHGKRRGVVRKPTDGPGPRTDVETVNTDSPQRTRDAETANTGAPKRKRSAETKQ